MRSFHYWWKAGRGTFALLTGFATWVSAVWFDGPHGKLLSQQGLLAAATGALLCSGSSFYHYAVARAMYRRKGIRQTATDHPRAFVGLGLLCYICAFCIAQRWLNAVSVGVVIGTACIILPYWHIYARHWSTKNTSIAIGCLGPLLLGWSITGTSPRDVWLQWFIPIAFFAYLGREIVKDVTDVNVDRGIRQTLPLRFGTFLARLAAGGTIYLACFEMIVPQGFLFGFLVPPSVGGAFFLASLLIFFFTALQLIIGRRATQRHATSITAGVGCFLLALLMTRLFGAPFYH